MTQKKKTTVVHVVRAPEHLLGIHVDLAECDRGVVHDPTLGPLVQRVRGVKPPRFPTLFAAVAGPLAAAG